MSQDLFEAVTKKPVVPLWAWLLGATLVAALGGVLWTRTRRAPPEAAKPVAAAPAPAVPADAPLPATADSDARLRSLLGQLTPMSRFHDWLATEDLLRRWVAVTDELASDTSPRAELPFLRPDRPFKAARTGGALEISPHSYARFDALGNVAGSIDPRVFAGVYHSLHPLLETAYHQLGYPGLDFDAVTARALQRVADAPVRDRAPALEPVGSLYEFADASLQSLGPVEKALLRVGPRNTRLLQRAARDLALALGLPLRTAPPAVQ